MGTNFEYKFIEREIYYVVKTTSVMLMTVTVVTVIS